MDTQPTRLAPSVVRVLAGFVVAIALLGALLAALGAVSSSSAAGLAVGALTGVLLVALVGWIVVRRHGAAGADAARLDDLEPLPPRER